jgi:hypothetical protein
MKVIANESQSNGTVTNARRICDEVGVGDKPCYKDGKFIIAWRLGLLSVEHNLRGYLCFIDLINVSYSRLFGSATTSKEYVGVLSACRSISEHRVTENTRKIEGTTRGNPRAVDRAFLLRGSELEVWKEGATVAPVKTAV